MSTSLRFDCFEVDLAAARIFKHGVRLHLREQPFQVLAMLLERPGEVVTREELRQRLWPGGVFVDFENNLNTAVARLRDVLNDSPEHPRFIETLPKRGYRFIAPLATPASPPQPAPAARTPTGDLVAYHEYVQGRRDLDRGTGMWQGFKECRARLESAVARDPGLGLAHEALAEVYWLLGYVGVMAPRDAFAAGILHAVRALEIDNTRAETCALVAQYRKQLDYAWLDIERELAAALTLNPRSSLARMLYAVGWLMPQGRLGDAITELECALEWDPLSYQVHFWRTIMHSLARQADRVVEGSRLLIELEPGGAQGHWLLGVGLSRQGRVDEGITSLQRAVVLSDGAALILGWLGLILGVCGRTDEARGALSRLEAMSRATYVPPASLAWVYLGLREIDHAFEWLERAVDARDQIMMPIKSYAFFDPIRADPRFHSLLSKMRLEA